MTRIQNSSLLEQMGYADYYYIVTYPTLLFSLGTVIWLVYLMETRLFPENTLTLKNKMSQTILMAKDYDGLVFNPFGDDSPKPRKSKKHSTKRKPSTRNGKTDPFSNNDGLMFNPFGDNNSSSTPKEDLGFEGLVQAGMNVKNTIDVIKTVHQNRMDTPTDPDHILARAKNIKAREKKKKDVQKARDYIIEHNAQKEKAKREAIYHKYGYIKGREIIKNQEQTKAQRLRKFLRR